MCGVRADENKVAIPDYYGKGFMHAFNFSSGVSAIVSDMNMKEDFEVKRNQQASSQSFTLLFNESVEKTAHDPNEKFAFDVFDMRKKIVRLSSSMSATQSKLPASFRIHSLFIIFNKQSLLNFLDFETVEKFISIYFSIYMKKTFVSPMYAEYSWVLQDLFHEIDKHPLNNLFTENRVLLLLERFLYNFLNKETHTGKKIQFKEEEISRLVKAENMLLNDFGKAPSTINVLAKACAMSPTKFKNDFKILYGLPVYEYYQKNRMAYARTLIKNGEHSIKQVGMMVGYSNLGHFAAAFKNEYKMLPSEWSHANRLQPDEVEEVK